MDVEGNGAPGMQKEEITETLIKYLFLQELRHLMRMSEVHFIDWTVFSICEYYQQCIWNYVSFVEYGAHLFGLYYACCM